MNPDRTSYPEIAVLAYNQEGCIGATLESVLSQSHGDFLLSIYDDNSSDGTEEICRGYASQDARINYVRNPANLGCNGNHQHAMELARGDFLTLLHGDDLLYPDFLLETVEKGLKQHPQAAFAYTLHERLVDDQLTGEMFQFVPMLDTGEHHILPYLCLTNWIITSFAVMRRENLNRIGNLTGYFNAGVKGFVDHYLFSTLASTGTAYVVNQRLGAYRIHEQTSTASLIAEKRYKESAIHTYDTLYRDMEHFEDKYRYLAKANQIGRLLTSRGIIVSALEMFRSNEIHDLMATFSYEMALIMHEALSNMVFDAKEEPASLWCLENRHNLDILADLILTSLRPARS